MSAIACCAAVLLASAAGAHPEERLWGTWRLVSFTRTVTATGATTDVFGRSPRGYIQYGRDGRMQVLIVKSERPRPVDVAKATDAERLQLFGSMVAYGGTYTFDGKDVVHHIDISANQTWTGTDQLRHVRWEGKRLVLTTPPQPSSYDGQIGVGVLTWEKVEPGDHGGSPRRPAQ